MARKLRQEQTDAERLLWSRLRRKYVSRVKFRRQEPIGPYVVDFVSFEKRLVVEVDGGHHNDEAVRLKDEERTRWLAAEGFRLLRFWNNEVLTNVDAVLEVIHRAVSEGVSPSPCTLPSRERA